MKVSLNLVKLVQRATIADNKLPVSIQKEIFQCLPLMEASSELNRGQQFIFVPHYNKSGKMDCVLANYGAYTRTMALDAKKDDVFETIMELSHKKPMFNIVIK